MSSIRKSCTWSKQFNPLLFIFKRQIEFPNNTNKSKKCICMSTKPWNHMLCLLNRIHWLGFFSVYLFEIAVRELESRSLSVIDVSSCPCRRAAQCAVARSQRSKMLLIKSKQYQFVRQLSGDAASIAGCRATRRGAWRGQDQARMHCSRGSD